MPKEKNGWVAQRARDGRWYARIKGTNPDGTKYDKTKFGTDKAHAEWLLQTLLLSRESSQNNVSGSDTATITFGRVLMDRERWWRDLKASEG